jgi:hypothetical protein
MKFIIKKPVKTFNFPNFIRFADEEMVRETIELLNDFFDSFVDEAEGLPIDLSYGNYWALYAAMEGNASLVEKLAARYKELGLDLSMDDNRLIRWACEKGHESIVKIALADPAVDPNAFDSEISRDNAMKLAARNGHYQIVQLLLSHPKVDPSSVDNYAIRIACQRGHINVVKVLAKDERVDPSALDNSCIKWASENGFDSIVEFLLSLPSVDPTATDNYALKQACAHNRKGVVDLLLKDGRCDPSTNASHCLKSACKIGNSYIALALLKDGRVQCDSDEALHWARHHRMNLVEVYILKCRDNVKLNNFATLSPSVEKVVDVVRSNQISLSFPGLLESSLLENHNTVFRPDLFKLVSNKKGKRKSDSLLSISSKKSTSRSDALESPTNKKRKTKPDIPKLTPTTKRTGWNAASLESPSQKTSTSKGTKARLKNRSLDAIAKSITVPKKRKIFDEPVKIRQSDNQQVYDIQEILAKRIRHGNVEYFVKWSGWPDADWLPYISGDPEWNEDLCKISMFEKQLMSSHKSHLDSGFDF